MYLGSSSTFASCLAIVMWAQMCKQCVKQRCRNITVTDNTPIDKCKSFQVGTESWGWCFATVSISLHIHWRFFDIASNFRQHTQSSLLHYNSCIAHTDIERTLHEINQMKQTHYVFHEISHNEWMTGVNGSIHRDREREISQAALLIGLNLISYMLRALYSTTVVWSWDDTQYPNASIH